MLKTFDLKPSQQGVTKIRSLKEAYDTVFQAIQNNVPDSSERQTALTSLQNSAQWAYTGIVSNDPTSERFSS